MQPENTGCVYKSKSKLLRSKVKTDYLLADTGPKTGIDKKTIVRKLVR